MIFQIGQKVVRSATVGVILTLEAGKRGRTLATVAFEDGRTLKVGTDQLEDAATCINNGFNPGWSKSGSGR